MEVFGITEKWQTASKITSNPRTLKAKVREYNNLFGTDDNHRYYIISGSWGYRLTTDKQEILASIDKEERLAKIRFKQMSRRRKKVYDYFSTNERFSF